MTAGKGVAAVACLAVASVMFQPESARSQELERDLPAHAHYSATEQGWTCNDGFKQLAGFCVEDQVYVPSQGPFEVYDGQWRCRSGYKRAGAFCVVPAAPEHATLVGTDGRWECDWGYRKTASRCEEINPPAHAYLDASGHDWLCYPAFQRSGDRCIAAATGAPESPVGPPAGNARNR